MGSDFGSSVALDISFNCAPYSRSRLAIYDLRIECDQRRIALFPELGPEPLYCACHRRLGELNWQRIGIQLPAAFSKHSFHRRGPKPNNVIALFRPALEFVWAAPSGDSLGPTSLLSPNILVLTESALSCNPKLSSIVVPLIRHYYICGRDELHCRNSL
jgi:hypothetical protein